VGPALFDSGRLPDDLPAAHCNAPLWHGTSRSSLPRLRRHWQAGEGYQVVASERPQGKSAKGGPRPQPVGSSVESVGPPRPVRGSEGPAGKAPAGGRGLFPSLAGGSHPAAGVKGPLRRPPAALDPGSSAKGGPRPQHVAFGYRKRPPSATCCGYGHHAGHTNNTARGTLGGEGARPQRPTDPRNQQEGQ
jgi:hypothetical protein